MRSVTLQRPVFRHGFAVSVLAQVTLWPAGAAGGLALAGGKHALAILLHDGRRLCAFDPGGRPLTPASVEALHPGAARSLSAAWHGHYGAPPAGFAGEPG